MTPLSILYASLRASYGRLFASTGHHLDLYVSWPIGIQPLAYSGPLGPKMQLKCHFFDTSKWTCCSIIIYTIIYILATIFSKNNNNTSLMSVCTSQCEHVVQNLFCTYVSKYHSNNSNIRNYWVIGCLV